jgi:hypothetical protein
VLNGDTIEKDYTEMTEQQVNDIITCVATVFMRANYTMDFTYTDLWKDANYFGFESGVYC